jgi:transposase
MVALAAADIGFEELSVGSSDEGYSRLVEFCAVLLAENEQLRGENDRLRGQCERLKVRVGELEGMVEELRRAAKRQAAPFSRGRAKEKPGRSGRRRGDGYGEKGHRPPPDEVDETFEAPTPERCECGGEIELEDVVDQFQEELPDLRPIRRRFRVYRGRCRCCGKRHQGRHPYQTSDALGAAGSMLGPRAVALATQYNKELGLSPQKTSRALLQFGISVTPGGVVQAIARQARALEPTYQALSVAVRHSGAIAPDETGWRVAARKQWLWAFVGDDGVTVYLIAGRGYEDAKQILGEDFSGVLERDGWAPYRSFKQARHQTCYAHLLKRSGELIEDSVAGQARVPHAVRRLLKDALKLRDQRDRPTGDPGADDDVIDAQEFGLRVQELERRTDQLLEINPTHEPNRRLLAHLRTERQHMFTFLTEPRVQATNWRAEQALRPAIVNRKNWGGNRSWAGARTQVVTISVIRTARQQQLDPIELMAATQLTRQAAVSDQIKLPTARSDPELLAA